MAFALVPLPNCEPGITADTTEVTADDTTHTADEAGGAGFTLDGLPSCTFTEATSPTCDFQPIDGEGDAFTFDSVEITFDSVTADFSEVG